MTEFPLKTGDTESVDGLVRQTGRYNKVIKETVTSIVNYHRIYI
jgi:hypothetical protein